MRRLDLVVGPNGAGKSTFVELTLAPLLSGSAFVNADEIAKQRWPDDPTSHSYEAAQVAAKTRAKLIELGTSFIAETVFSHPSKLELITSARAADYTIVLHVLLIPVGLAVERVRHRVKAGGHEVPETKIRATLPTSLGPRRCCDSPLRFRDSVRQQQARRTAHRGPGGPWLPHRLASLAFMDA